MKIKLSELEKQIGKKFKRNTSSIGIDLATKSGICIATTNERYIDLDMSFINFETTDEYKRYNEMVDIFEKVMPKVNVVIIEDTFFGLNPKTFKLLSRFGGIIYCLAYQKDKNNSPKFICASSARKRIGIFPANCKKPVVHQWIVDNLKIKQVNEDISDAIVLALNGLLEE